MEQVLSIHVMNILTNTDQVCLKTAFKLSFALGKEQLNIFIKNHTNKLEVGTIIYVNERIYEDQDDQKNCHEFPILPEIYKTDDGNIESINHSFSSWFRISKIKYNKYNIECEYDDIKREEIINMKDKKITYKPNFSEISKTNSNSWINIYSKYKKTNNYPKGYKFNGCFILCCWHVNLELYIYDINNKDGITFDYIEKKYEN